MLRLGVFLLRLMLFLLTGAACFAAGVHASIAAFAAVLHWPLSELNLEESISFGIGFGLIGTVSSFIALCHSDRKYQVLKAVAAVLLTWLVTYVCVWFCVVSSLG
jgi:hypothetical protein